MMAAYDSNLQQHEIFDGDDPQSILNRAAFQGDLIQVMNIILSKRILEIEYKHPLKLASIRGYSEIVKSLLKYSPLNPEYLIKLLWHSSINLRSNVVGYLLGLTNLKEALPKEEVQKLLLELGVSIMYHTFFKKISL